MTETALVVADIVGTGLLVAQVAAAAGGNYFANTGDVFVEITNGDATSTNVTIDAFPTGNVTGTPDGLTVTDRVIAIAAGATKKIGPFKMATYNDGSGDAHISFSKVTSLTLQAYRLRRVG